MYGNQAMLNNNNKGNGRKCLKHFPLSLPHPLQPAAWWQSWKWQFTFPVLDSGPWFLGKQSRPYLQIIACVCPNLSGGCMKNGYKVLTQGRKVMGIIWKYCAMNRKIFSLLGQKTTAKTVENASKHLKRIKHQFYTISFRQQMRMEHFEPLLWG